MESIKYRKLFEISSREYCMAWIEGNEPIALKDITLSEFFNESEGEDFEWKYAIQDNIDAVLDLGVGFSTRMQFNRDDSTTTGYIKRTK